MGSSGSPFFYNLKKILTTEVLRLPLILSISIISESASPNPLIS